MYNKQIKNHTLYIHKECFDAKVCQPPRLNKIHSCETGSAVTPCILSGESDFGPKEGRLMLFKVYKHFKDYKTHSLAMNM